MPGSPTYLACARCRGMKPRSEFLYRGRLCSKCRADDLVPKATETEWQNTVEQALTQFGFAWMHVRRTRGKGGKWTTSTSHAGWPDLVAMRGPHVLGIELKSESGTPTDEQLEWLARFARIVGGRGWIVTPRDPEWQTFTSWLRDPSNAPRRHGW